jgi:hypothetical protein
VWTELVVVIAPPSGDDANFVEGVEDFAVEQLVA